MKSLDALSEVSREMELMAHFLHVVSHDKGIGADLARDLSQDISALQQKIENRLGTVARTLPSAKAPGRIVAMAGR